MDRIQDLRPVLLGWTSTIEATYEISRMTIRSNVPGDFVECGVFAGAQSAAMARAILDEPCTTFRRVHLFDSFDGILPAGPMDKNLLDAGHKGGEARCSLDQVKSYMQRWRIPDELLVYHPGWFSDTVPKDASGISSISVLRLDGDLYESTKVCMEHLYPLLAPGGWLIVDDWNLDGCRRAIDESSVLQAPIYYRVPR